MTEDEIRNMPAGRYIDLLIGRDVMNFSSLGPSTNDWCPSTDMAMAWEVVDKMEYPHPANFEIRRLQSAWVCEISNPYPNIIVFADTAPLAICRAFLLANFLEKENK